MKRIYHKYTDWEDFKNGMYGDVDPMTEEEVVRKCVSLLCDSSLFLSTMISVIKNWPICTEENLSNVNCNRRAWLGQASCCFLFAATERHTRKAWAILSDREKVIANNQANKIINHYEEKNRKILAGLGGKMLF